jgi:hypothetical protein
LILTVPQTGLKHPQVDWPLLLCDDDLPDALHRLLRLGEQLLQDLMAAAHLRTTHQSAGSVSCMASLADAMESKQFQGAFTKV